MDAVTVPPGTNDARHRAAGIGLPLADFLFRCHAEIGSEGGGALADYIPELTRANPAHFGIGLATIDGYIYEAGDSAVPFTIQSISKAFVFALALEILGGERVEQVIGVEPSGDAFNSIRLRPDNRPFNPMVNAGAIACSGLICEAEGDGAFGRILDALSRLAGRPLDVDESVFASERATGDRNRAIAYLLRNHGVLSPPVDEVLDVYFRQCSILVTARDLAVMAATLANRGVNPVTGKTVLTPYAVARTLSVMTSSGMYDYAGEWVYRVGIPAKSGVGGGILAALPAQLGLGTYSPLLDDHGNSVRGLKTCEALAEKFDLHVLNRSGDVRSCIIAEYDMGNVRSRRNRQTHEQRILDARHRECRVIEVGGAVTFENAEYISRRLASASADARFVILDFRRVPSLTTAAGLLLADGLRGLGARGLTTVLSGVDSNAVVAEKVRPMLETIERVRKFGLLDEAIEWVEDQIVYLSGGYETIEKIRALGEQELLAGLDAGSVEQITALTVPRELASGERMIEAGTPASSIFFLLSGMVSVKLPNGVRLATLSAGMSVGEMALLEAHRSADVWCDTPVHCLELPLDAYVAAGRLQPDIRERIVRNLAAMLAKRLIQANTKIETLTS